jgi:hypothetical protein
MKLLGGVVLMLVIAGMIEGFITPLRSNLLPPEGKVFFALILLAAFAYYLWRAGSGVDAEKIREAETTTTHLRLD